MLEAKTLPLPPGVEPLAQEKMRKICFVNVARSDFWWPGKPPTTARRGGGVPEWLSNGSTPWVQQETSSRLSTLRSLSSEPMRDFIAGVQKAVHEALEPLERAQATAQD